MGVREAQLKQVDARPIVDSEGWLMLDARDATWVHSEERGQDTDFEGRQEWRALRGRHGRSRAGGFEVVYPVNDVAAKHGASALEETSRPEDEATARWGPEERSAYRAGLLPDLGSTA